MWDALFLMMRRVIMMSSNDNNTKYHKRRKLFSILSLIAFIIVSVLLTLLFTKILSPYLSSADDLRKFLDTFGWKGRFILLGLQCLQVVVAFIPGEIIELGAGYAYGTLQGLFICLVGVAASSSIVFLLVKKIGTPMVETFISREKMNQLTFLKDENKLKRLTFWLFFIPGTPKDVLTYFVGLTDMSLMQFLSITLIARIPSIISSTVCGQMLGDKDYVTAGIVFAVTGIISILGYYLYNKFVNSKKVKYSGE